MNIEEIIRQLEENKEFFMNWSIAWREHNQEISFMTFQIAENCRKAAENLRKLIPQEMELEGGGSTWWYVCPECHGAIDSSDSFCKHCGQAVK